MDSEEQERVKMLKDAVLTLQSCLQQIVEKQKSVLQDDEEYQKKFYKLCNDIGVDPFAQKKGFLSGLLNRNLEEFYKKLGMRVLSICLNTRYENGGLIPLTEIKQRLNQNKTEHIHREDIRIAVQKLSCLSSSLSIEKIEGVSDVVEYVKSADMEFTGDSLKVLSRANRLNGKVRPTDISVENVEKWRKELDLFVDQGIAWVDVHQGTVTYYFPSIVFGSSFRVCKQTIGYFLFPAFLDFADFAACKISSIQSIAASSRSRFSVVILKRYM